MTRSDFRITPKSFLYLCKGKIIYRKNSISCNVQSTNTFIIKIESDFMKINLEKIIKYRKKTTYNL